MMFEDIDWEELIFKGFLVLTFGPIIILIIALFVGLFISCFPVTLVQTMEDGQHTGFISAVDTEGLIWKTTIVYFKTDSESSQEDSYCVIDRDVKENLLKAQRERLMVTLHYDDYFIVGMPICHLSASQIITFVEFSEKREGGKE